MGKKLTGKALAKFEAQGMTYLAEVDPNGALTPEAGGGLHLSHCARSPGGANSAESANRAQPTGPFHAARLRQGARL